jgi:hypothetical protein
MDLRITRWETGAVPNRRTELAMIAVRWLILFALLTCASMAASPLAAQTDEAKRLAPVVNECEPHSGSVNSVIDLKGFRLAPESAAESLEKTSSPRRPNSW